MQNITTLNLAQAAQICDTRMHKWHNYVLDANLTKFKVIHEFAMLLYFTFGIGI